MVIIISVSARERNSETDHIIQFGVLLCEGVMEFLYLTHMCRRSGKVG